MPKAVLKNGVIMPLEPLPAEWADGRALRVESEEEDEERDFDPWFLELQSLVAGNDAADLERVEQALKLADEQAKASCAKR